MDKNQFYVDSQADERETGGYSPLKIDFILKTVGGHKTVLDVACNDGFISKLIKEQDNQVYGFDIVDENLAIAKKSGIITEHVDIEKDSFPYKENFFDFVILGDVIEHVFDTDSLLKKCLKVLKPGGKVIVTTPNIASIGRRLMLMMGVSPYVEYSIHETTNGYPSVGHIRYFTAKTLHHLMEADGYTPVRVISDTITLPFLKIKSLGAIFPNYGTMLFAVGEKPQKS